MIPNVEGQQGNLTWARNNRFNEACYFLKPIIAQEGTVDGNIVETLDLGLALDLSDVQDCIRRVLSISNKDLARWKANIKNLPKEKYLLGDEHKKLMEALLN